VLSYSVVIKTQRSIYRDNLGENLFGFMFFGASIHKFSAAEIYDHYTLKLQINWINTPNINERREAKH
jgi:hypothetical protein